jgi:hypothetical protein
MRVHVGVETDAGDDVRPAVDSVYIVRDGRVGLSESDWAAPGGTATTTNQVGG